MPEPLIVTIRCLVYNHEPYLRQCLDGFVMQKTNFRFEAIVHDDASTDNSADIIREYAEKYPDIIKPILETENQYSKHDGSIRRIMNAHTHGKYCALCEGDDYWTDPYKLQKQVDFLESHPDYAMCFHNAIQHWQDDLTKKDSLFSNIENREYSGIELYNRWIVPTASVMFCKQVIDSKLYIEASNDRKFIFGDTVLFLCCARYGKVYGMNDVMSVYRRLSSGLILQNHSDEFLQKRLQHTLEFEKIFGSDLKPYVRKKYIIENLNLFYKRICLLKLKLAFQYLKQSFGYNIFYTIYYMPIVLIKMIVRKIRNL